MAAGGLPGSDACRADGSGGPGGRLPVRPAVVVVVVVAGRAFSRAGVGGLHASLPFPPVNFRPRRPRTLPEVVKALSRPALCNRGAVGTIRPRGAGCGLPRRVRRPVRSPVLVSDRIAHACLPSCHDILMSRACPGHRSTFRRGDSRSVTKVTVIRISPGRLAESGMPGELIDAAWPRMMKVSPPDRASTAARLYLPGHGKRRPRAGGSGRYPVPRGRRKGFTRRASRKAAQGPPRLFPEPHAPGSCSLHPTRCLEAVPARL